MTYRYTLLQSYRNSRKETNMTLLEMSIYGAVIILVVLILRVFTLHKLPKKTFLILWSIALLRLLVPFEIDFPPANLSSTRTGRFPSFQNVNCRMTAVP